MNCPVFGEFVTSLDEDRRYEILDLGPALPQNLEFLSRYRCRLHISDSQDAIARHDLSTEEDNPLTFSELLPIPAEATYDILLFWDIFNYLEPSDIRLLMDHLKPHIKSGTQLYVLNTQSGDIPATPNRYRIVDEQQLLCEHTSIDFMPSPCHAQRVLEKHLLGFSLQRGMLLKNGQQEFLFTLK
ncbi:MAG: hypothetical protein ACWA5Q_04360 [bacterium]